MMASHEENGPEEPQQVDLAEEEEEGEEVEAGTDTDGTDMGDEEMEEDEEGADHHDGASSLPTDEETDATDEEDEEDEEEEEQVEVYPLPPLPPVHAPPKVHGIATAEVYSIIKELRRQMDDPVEREHARSMLQGDTDVLLAVAQVLQEAHLLRRSTVNEHGEVEEQLVRQPEAPRPSLPTGYNSWIVENQSQLRR